MKQNIINLILLCLIFLTRGCETETPTPPIPKKIPNTITHTFEPNDVINISMRTKGGVSVITVSIVEK